MSTISDSKYILNGFIILVMSTFVLIVFVNHLRFPVENTQQYILDTCKIYSISFTTASFDCWQSGSVSIAQIPCVQIFVNTTKLTGLFFYRNYFEKEFLISNNLNCSYAPSACQNDPNYLDRVLRNSILKLFPPSNFTFECFVEKKNNDVLLYLPDSISYYVSLGVISFGICLSALFILYGFLNNQINSKRKYLNFFSEFFNSGNEDEFAKYVKKVLGETHINAYDLSIYDLDNLSSIVQDNDSLSYRRTLRSRSSSFLHGSFSSDQSYIFRGGEALRSSPSKIKLGPNEISIGRIEYRAPSCSRMSRQESTRNSFSSSASDGEKPNFYVNYDSASANFNDELDIPDVILEEDERYLTLQKKETESNPTHAAKIFSQLKETNN